MAQEFGTRLTPDGHQKIADAIAQKSAINIITLAAGDGDWGETEPNDLINQVWSGPVNSVNQSTTASGVTEVEGVIPATEGGFVINEVAFKTDDGKVFAISRYPSSYKATPDSGVAGEMSIVAMIAVGVADVVNLSLNPDVVMASKKFVEDETTKIADSTGQQIAQIAGTVNGLPLSFLVTLPVLTGDAEQAYNNNVSLAVSGGVSAYNNTDIAATIDHYEWILPDGSLLNAPTAVWPIPNDPALVDAEYEFKVRAVDSIGNFSAWVVHQTTVVGNRRPNMDGFVHNVPNIAVKKQVVSVAFSGASDIDGEDNQITYRISNPVNVTASKVDDIVGGVALDLTFADVAINSSAGITVVAIDQAGVQSAPQVITVDLRKLAIVEAPVGLAPAADAIDINSQPYLSVTPFSTNPLAFDTHKATHIQVASDDQFTSIIADMTTAAVTSVRLDQPLSNGQLYFWRMRFEGATLGWSAWSEVFSFTTTAIAPGFVLEDGGIVGPQVDGYHLIIAPASARGHNMMWSTTNTETVLANVTEATTPDTRSGLGNTDLLVGYSYIVAAKFCRAMGNEWYLPNKEELKAIVDMSAQIDTADASTGHSFASMVGSHIWSSTENSYYVAWCVGADGTFAIRVRTTLQFVVPVRRIPV